MQLISHNRNRFHSIHRATWLVLSALLLTASAGAGLCAAARRQVVMVVADYLSVSDLARHNMPAIQKLIDTGGSALITPSAVSSRNPEASYASASAGANCWGSADVDGAYSRGEYIANEDGDAAEVYARRTGRASSSPVLHTGVFLLRADNQSRGASSLPGALGDAVEADGKTCAAIGNSDAGGAENLRRRAALIATDSNGCVAVGDVSARLTKPDPLAPAGFVTDTARLSQAVDSALEKADFVVVDFGDLARVELNREKLSTKAYAAHRARALTALESFLEQMMKGRAGSATVILVSMVAPFGPDLERHELSPIVISGPGVRRGSLISATTRTAGLVSTADFAPTVLSTLRVSVPKAMIGGRITTTAGGMTHIERLSKLVVLDKTMLVPVLALMGGLGIAALTLACLVLVMGKVRRYSRTVKVLMVAIASSPLAVLIATMGTPDVLPFILVMIGSMAGLTVLSFSVAMLLPGHSAKKGALPAAAPLAVVMLISCAAFLVDALLGGEFSRFTMLSAGRFDGYRFYGIGNEYMGVWLGMSLFLLAWGLECRMFSKPAVEKAVTIGVSVVIVAALGFARFGANAGGAVAAVTGFGLLYRSRTARRFGIWEVLGFTAAGFLLVALIGFADIAFSGGAPSHIGRAAAAGGSGWHLYLAKMALRKATMNLELIGTPQAKYAILGSIPFWAMWFWVIRRKFDDMTSGRESLRWSIAAAAVASIAAFLFNDSGIVAWGLINGFVAAGIVFALIEREETKCSV